MSTRQNLRRAKSQALLNTDFGDYDDTLVGHPPSRAGGRSRTPKSRSSTSVPHIPRPRNPFIIYRSEFAQRHRDMGLTQSHLSQAAADTWGRLSEQEKMPFIMRAEQDKIDHAARYPGYKFRPAKKGSKAKTAGTSTVRPESRSSSASQPVAGPSHYMHATLPAANVVYVPYPVYPPQAGTSFNPGPPPIPSEYTGYTQSSDVPEYEPSFDYNVHHRLDDYTSAPYAATIPQQTTPWDEAAMDQYINYYGHPV